MQFKSFMEALKGNQHKLDKNKNGKLDAHDFKLLQKEEDDIEEGVDRVERADFKTNPSGRKSHKEITFKNGEPETDEIKAKSQREEVEMQERSMTDAEMKKREDYVKGMKKNVAGFKAKYGERAKDVMYATATKMAMKEETVEEAFINGREYASHGLMHPDHAGSALHKVTGQSIDFYAHGSGDKVEGKVTKNDGKAVHIKDTKGTTHKFKVQRGLPKQNNEELEMQEQAPVAPSLMKHRISVTVSDPDHTMVSKRKEKMQKTVVVTHSDNKEGAQKVGEKFYKKKGFIVHDSHHAGMVNEQKDPPFDGPYKKAEEPKTDKSGAVHSPMSRARHLARQAMKKQMKENFDLDISDEQADSLVEAASTEQLDELSKSTIGSYIKKAKTSAIGASQVAGMGSNIVGQKTADKAEKKVQKRAQGINKAVDRLTREESNFDEEGNLMAEKLTFSDFIDKLNEQLLEYETKSGVYRHKGSYGSAYQGDADDEDDKPKKAAAPDAPKRGRGRPAGSTGASYKPRSAETKAAAAAKAAATKAANKK